MSRVCAVVGAQYGSEGKGVIVHHLADRFGVHVRVGGPNAGHSFSHMGRVWKMRSMPCGWTNKDAWLVIGPGALFNPELLEEEVQAVEQAGFLVRGRLLVDYRAGVIEDADRRQAMLAEARHRYGSTQEGVGVARHRKLDRDPHTFRRALDLKAALNFQVADTIMFLRSIVSTHDVLLEGTQGCHLSLTTGPWPFVTNQDTNVAQLCSDAGVAPGRMTDVVLVARTFPIRVGGNSGPMAGREISWPEISARFKDGRKVEEHTTVTGRVRRVCEWSDSLLHEAVWLNKPTALALMFVDYWFPEVEGKRDLIDLPVHVVARIATIATNFGVPVEFVGTGGEDFAVIETGEAYGNRLDV